MRYKEYKQQPGGWKGLIEDENGNPYMWIHSDGTWKLESQINRGPFGGDQDVMLRYMREEGFLCGEAKCMNKACNWEWTAVSEDENANGSLECPRCGDKSGTIFS